MSHDVVRSAGAGFDSSLRKMLIDGEWRAGTDAPMAAIDPATDEELCAVAMAGADDVDDAVAAARRSFDAAIWHGKSPAERARILWSIADLIDRHADELAHLETLDTGKPFGIARYVDVAIAAEAFRYHAGWITKITGGSQRISYPGLPRVASQIEPVGVVALIVPWNFPLGMAAFKLAPALAAGCSCVLKPAEITSLTALRLGELALEAGVPPGVVNILPGRGATAGAGLAAHKDVDKISFTGSTATGRAIVMASAGNLKRLSLELGGKSPFIVLADADTASASAAAAQAIFFNSGQICTAASRLLVHDSLYDQLLTAFASHAKALVMGSGLDPATQMGPLVSRAHRERVHGHVDRARQDGGSILCGGAIPEGIGSFYPPTVITDVDQHAAIVQEEVFGPVVTVQRFHDRDEAIALANDSAYGLSASVWTQDIHAAQHFVDALKSGTVGINCHNVVDPALSFGGRKSSGYGYENGARGLEQFLVEKAVVTA